MPPAVALEARHLQKRHGLSKQKLADHIGIRRPQLANGLHGTYRLSNWASAQHRETLPTDHQILEARAA